MFFISIICFDIQPVNRVVLNHQTSVWVNIQTHLTGYRRYIHIPQNHFEAATRFGETITVTSLLA